MNNKLNNLYVTLNKLGSQNAANEISLLIGELETAGSKIISKANWQTNLFGVGSEPLTNTNSEAWQKIIDDYDKPAYRVEAFHTIAEGIAATVIGPIVSKFNAAKADEEVQVGPADRAETISRLRATANVGSVNMLGLSKIASASNYSRCLSEDTDRCINKILSSLPSNYISSSEVNYIKRELLNIKVGSETAVSTTSEVAADVATKARPGWFSRAMPVVGLVISIPLAIKNTVEAWNNGVAIFTELPLQKYGVSKLSIASGPAGLPFFSKTIKVCY